MDAINQLRKVAMEYRYYEISAEIRYSIRNTLQDFRIRFPDDAWDEEYLVEIKDNYVYGTKPIIKWGSVDTSIFQKKWGIALPGWMEEFYSQVTCGMLPMLNQIAIFSPERAVQAEDERREACGELHLPHRLIRFADGAEDGGGFSLRQKLADDQWEIIKTGVEYNTEEYQSEEWEGGDDKDVDINVWLLRMLNTDGHPLMIGRGHIEPMYSRRLN